MVVHKYLKPPRVSVARYLTSLEPERKPIVLHFTSDWHSYSSPAFANMLPAFEYYSIVERYSTTLTFVKIHTDDPEYNPRRWRLDRRGTAPTFMAFDECGVEIMATTKKGTDGVQFFLEKFARRMERGTFRREEEVVEEEEEEEEDEGVVVNGWNNGVDQHGEGWYMGPHAM